MARQNDNEFLSSYLVYSLPIIFLIPYKARTSEWWPFPSLGPVEVSFFVALALLTLYFYEALKHEGKLRVESEQWILLIFIIHTIISLALVYMGFRPTLEFLGGRLYSSMPHYFLAIMVLIVVRRNNWKVEHYEKLIRVLLFISLIWTLESILAFYLGVSIPRLDSTRSSFGENYFSSGFTNSLHVVSKVSIISTWLSIYMFYKHKSAKYLIYALLFFAVIMSTLNRASIAAVIIFGVFLSYFLLFKYSDGTTKQNNHPLRKIISIVVITSVFSAGSYFISNKSLLTSELTNTSTVITTGQFARAILEAILDAEVSVEELAGASSLLTDVHAYAERLFQYIRAIEVVIQYPLGNGAGIGYNVCYSKDASMIFTEQIRRVEPFLTISKFYQTGIFGADMQQNKVGTSPAFSIHNITLNWLLDFGIFALYLLFIYLKFLLKLFKYSIFLLKKKFYHDGKLALILLCAQSSVFLAMQATGKFQSFWILVFLYCFSNALFVDFSSKNKQMFSKKSEI